MSNIKYKQCRLHKTDGESIKVLVSWIPEKFAVEGTTVQLKQGETWTDGWVVMSASGESVSEETVTKFNRAYLKQRKASDI